MNVHTVRKTFALLALAAIALSPSNGLAQKKKPHGDEAAPSAPAMTFEVEPTDASATTPAPKGKKEKAAAGKPLAPPDTPAGPPSKTLDRATKLYDSEDYYSASIELNKVVEGQTADDEANRQRAEFFMGKTLFNMK